MAVVNILDAFTYKWAQLGTAEPLTDDQWKVGWSFIGAVPPSVEQFNKWGQIFDEKSNYLYSQLKTIYDLTGVVPSPAGASSLRDALVAANLFSTLPPGTNDTRVATTGFVKAASDAVNAGRLLKTTIYATPGSFVFTPVAGTTYIEVEGCGGGGGGGGVTATAAGEQAAGAGGSGGGYFRKKITSGFTGVTVTVGAAGVGGTGASLGTAGGTTSFGAVVGYAGGTPGSPGGAATISGSNTFPTGTGIPPNTGIGSADIFATGGQGFSAWYGPGGSAAGQGGSSYLGPGAYGPISLINLNSNGFNAASNGAGGGGALNGPSQAARKGGDGGTGIMIIREYSA